MSQSTSQCDFSVAYPFATYVSMLFQNSMSNFTKDVLYIQTIVYSWKLCLAPRKTVFVKSDTRRPLQVVNYVAKHRIIIFPKGFLYTNKEWDKKIKIFDVISRFYKQINCNSDLRAYNEIVCVQFFLLIGHKDLGFAYVFIRWTLHCEPYHVVLHKEPSLLLGHSNAEESILACLAAGNFVKSG